LASCAALSAEVVAEPRAKSRRALKRPRLKLVEQDAAPFDPQGGSSGGPVRESVFQVQFARQNGHELFPKLQANRDCGWQKNRQSSAGIVPAGVFKVKKAQPVVRASKAL